MIRPANPNDFSFLYELYMHPQVNPFLLYEPMPAESFKPIYAKLLEDGIKYVFEEDGLQVGMLKLIPYEHRSGHTVYLGGLAVHPSFAGQGKGTTMMNEIIAFAGAKGFLRVELSAAVSNEKAVHLYEKCGFKKEGILQKYTHLKSENRFLDEVLMAYVF